MQQIIAILFLGNSLTYTNDLPKMFADSAPVKVHTESVTVPGGTLQILYEQTEALQKLRSRKWDYVVLQEQGSLGIAAVNGRRAVNDPKAFFSWSRIWDREIRSAGAKTVFFHSWVRKVNPEDRPYVDYAFLEIARELNAVNVPVGLAWARMPQDGLYVPDGLHPTIAGSYLTACVFTQALFARDCVHPPSPLSLAEAGQIRTVAAGAVKDGARMKPDRPVFAAVKALPPVEKVNLSDFVGIWEGETRFYRDPSKLTLKITKDGEGCRISYNVDGPEMRYVDTTARCAPSAEGVQITINQPSGAIEIHSFQVRGGTMAGVSRIALYTAYLRREAAWTLQRVQ